MYVMMGECEDAEDQNQGLDAVRSLNIPRSLAGASTKKSSMGSILFWFLCPPQLLHTEDLAFQPSVSPKSILALGQMGFELLRPCEEVTMNIYGCATVCE